MRALLMLSLTMMMLGRSVAGTGVQDIHKEIAVPQYRGARIVLAPLSRVRRQTR
ncbi:MAG: hypothetical protein U5O39_12155 [Gammaproteobacteria bacterium]|nr:hypothetical protein [Gammaproteobacteria bacterium]